jgi:hypothetical protein
MTMMTRTSQTVEISATDLVTQQEVMADPRVYDAQAEVFWLAFQTLPPPTKQLVRERLTRVDPFSFELARELASWQAAANEALLSFEAMLDDPT